MIPGRQEVESDPASLDFERHDDSAHKAPSTEQMVAAEREAIAGESAIASKGSYISIARRAKNIAPRPEGGKYELLLIDDDVDFTRVMEKLLGMAGYAVRIASNRPAISRELRRPTLPHLILLDVGLRELNGFDILVRLRHHSRLGSIPVIMLTGHTTRKDVVRGLLGGADGYVSKPCRFFALNHAIRTVLDIH